MKSILRILQESNRIIEFSDRVTIFPEDIAARNTFLTIRNGNDTIQKRDNSVVLDRNDFLHAIERNSSDVIVLNSSRIRELKALQKTHNAVFLFERITLLSSIPLIYFLFKSTLANRYKYGGVFLFRTRKALHFYLGCKRVRPVRKRTRHYLTPLVEIENVFHTLNGLNIKYCILRWYEDLPHIPLNEDIDVLVDDSDLDKLTQVIDARPGIVPFDIYSKTGTPGSDFRGVPYYALPLAEKSLKEATLYRNNFMVPTPANHFYLLAYHAVFHKGEHSGLPSARYELGINHSPDHDYLTHLKRIVSKTQLEVEDWTLEGLHTLLESRGYAPPADTQYKLSLQNQYLRARLADSHQQSEYPTKFQGLVCFVARERVIESRLLDSLKMYVQKEGFTILRVKLLEEPYKTNFTAKVRGGNWGQGPWPVSGGPPAAVILALDVYPVAPTRNDHNKHPGISNRRIKNKTVIRDFINQCLPDESEWFNGVHSSDNEIQAVEYLRLAGLNENDIHEQIVHYRQAFVTTYPVVGVLSQYSKRAKVELISYRGSNAVKKTFKPMCEQFLSNEIEAHKIFKGILPTPELLETGDNYLITSYIDGAKPLDRRISIRTLRQCLRLLRQLYEAGYSLLDFKPGNFLVDRKNNIYLIDFEFLYKYETKPDFLNCYDLVGLPDNFDPSVAPQHRIPKGIKQFDALWYNSTHVKYDELSELDRFATHVKSKFRYYRSRVNTVGARLTSAGKKVTLTIYRRLP